MPAATRRWRLDVAYRGDGFHGFAAQPGQETVAGALAGALAVACRLDAAPAIVCAGRTDAGVHALGQVVHVELPEDRCDGDGPEAGRRLARSVNALLAGRVTVVACRVAPDGFDARRSATSRTYRYLLHVGPSPSPLLAGLAWHLSGPLDVRGMAQAAYAVLGEHDFRAFCRRPSGADPDAPLRRRVLDVAIDGLLQDPLGLAGPGELVRVDVTATSFCHQMVRSLVSALVAIGTGSLSGADVVDRLRTGDRAGLPAPAPPEGLCLLAVGYA